MKRYYDVEGYQNEEAFEERLAKLHNKVDGSTLPELLKIRAQLYRLKQKYELCGRRYLECEGEIIAINEIIAECRKEGKQ